MMLWKLCDLTVRTSKLLTRELHYISLNVCCRVKFANSYFHKFLLTRIAFTALTLLVGLHEEHVACKIMSGEVGAGVVICLRKGQMICIWSS